MRAGPVVFSSYGLIRLTMPRSTKPKKTTDPGGAHSPRQSAESEERLSPDYREYLRRYAELGEGRPKLSPAEYDQLDDELLDLLAIPGSDLEDDQEVRIRELEYLLIDPE